MGVNKVVYGTTVLVDLSKDTVAAGTLAMGVTAHGADGEPIVGRMTGEGGIDTSDATAKESDILNGLTAYGKTGKMTGTLKVQSYYTGPAVPEYIFGEENDLYLMSEE